MYPALHKLNKDGLVTVETVNIGKRVRRYYSLTSEGVIAKKEKVAEIKDFITTLGNVLL